MPPSSSLPDGALSQRIWAIIPVKQLHQSKSRLAHVLNAAQRAQLMLTFLQRELEILRTIERIEQTVVVSSDAQVVALAHAYAAQALVETSSRGMDVAVQEAVEMARAAGVTAVLIIPADLPFLQAADITALIDAWENTPWPALPGIILGSDSHHEGTNALMLSPQVQFIFHYGRQSLQKHLAEAQKRGLAAQLVPSPGLAFDLDTEQDWQTFLAQGAKICHEWHEFFCVNLRHS